MHFPTQQTIPVNLKSPSALHNTQLNSPNPGMLDHQTIIHIFKAHFMSKESLPDVIP